MIRSLALFLGTFVVGALLALLARAALFSPHAAKEANAVGGGDYAPMVTNTLAPQPASPAPALASTPPHEHNHAQPEAKSKAETPAQTASANQPVNTVCAICGMVVDPKLPTSTYQGKTIGFGCRMCRPKFEKDPDRWGPHYLKNEVVSR